LREEYIEVNLTGMLDSIGEVVSEEEKGDMIKAQVKTQAKPAALKVMEAFSGPIHISDVTGEVEGDKLKLRVWKRMGGLRAAPILLDFASVDNPEAAKAFVTELNERKQKAEHLGRFFGPLDYWLGWIALAVVLIVLWRWPRDRANGE
jgi:hypothetical protein